MNKIKSIIGLALCASALTSPIHAQEQNSSERLWNFFQPLTQATNWAAVPYLTYAPDIQSDHKVGGGLLALYNVNEYVGAGLGLDWLGQFNLVSGNVTLRLPVHPLAFIGSEWAKNFTVTPFGIGGIATPLGGAGEDNGRAAGIFGGGASFEVLKLAGGQVSTGAAVVNWTEAGDYSGNHYQIFLSWNKDF